MSVSESVSVSESLSLRLCASVSVSVSVSVGVLVSVSMSVSVSVTVPVPASVCMGSFASLFEPKGLQFFWYLKLIANDVSNGLSLGRNAWLAQHSE